MRLYANEHHVIKREELDAFIENKESNGFTVTSVSDYDCPKTDTVKKLVTIEKWNRNA